MDRKRFEIPVQGRQFDSEYDLPSDMLIDLNQRDVAPIYVITLDLTNAGSQWFQNQAGRAFVPYFWQTGTANKARAPEGFVTGYVNESNANNPNAALMCKHNRGYRGSFSQLFISWTAQPGVSVDLVFLRSKQTPWMTDGITPPIVTPSFSVFTVAAPGITNIGAGENFFKADATLGNITFTTVGITAGQLIAVSKIDASANTVTIPTAFGPKVLGLQGDANTFFSDGVNLYPIG